MSNNRNGVTRRQFIKRGMLGLTAVAIGSDLQLSLFPRAVAYAQGHANEINLGMATADVEMVDGIRVPHWVYTLQHELGQAEVPTLPGPAIFAFENEPLTINVTNSIPGPARRFAVVGNDFAGNQFALVRQTGEIPFGGIGSLTIAAHSLSPGTYLYKDPTKDPISRLLGLHGALIILPANATQPVPVSGNKPTPYNSATPNVQNLFNALGAGTPRDPHATFPGQPWFATTDANPAYGHIDSDHHHHEHFIEHPNGPQSHVFERFLYRTRIWLHSSIDPELNRAVIDRGANPDPATVKDSFLPQYFSINGRQGAFAAHSPDVMPMGTVGEPHLIRLLNAGLAHHSPHLHANHFYVTSINNAVGGGGVFFGNELGADNLCFVDAVTLGPEDRIDWVMPFIRPPDIPRVLEDGTIFRPGSQANGRLLMPLARLIPEELATVLIAPQNPLSWPMHSHMELDQTAAGGNYPQGAVLGWEITGEFGEDFFPRAATAVELAIKQFKTTNNVRLSRNQRVDINLRVRNTGTVSGSVPATVVGAQNGVEIYREALLVSDPVGGGDTSWDFPPHIPEALGDITWTATLQGATATATTRVRP